MPDERRPPREIAEAQVLELRHASRAKLAHEVARVRLALAELESATLAALAHAAAVALLERSATGRAGTVPNIRELVALAIAGRLGSPCEPYLDAIGDGWEQGPEWAEHVLLEIVAGVEDPS